MIRKEAAVRAFTPEPDRKPHRNAPWYLPRQILVLDTETWIDPAQAFRFGFFRYARLRWGRSGAPAISVVEESIVHADDPSPSELKVLQGYRRTHRARVDHSVLGAQYRIALYSRADFEKTVLSRAFRSNTTWVIGANLPFDLSRLVAPHLSISSTGFEAGPGYNVDRETRKRTRRDEPGFYTGGFSLPVSEYQDEDGAWHERGQDEPRLALKRLGPQRTAMGLIWSKGATRRDFHGHFLDVLTFGAALSGEHLPLTAEPPGKGFCELFGVDYPAWLERFGVPFGKREAPHGERLSPEYISYNRADVGATAELFGALMAEHRSLGIKTQPTRIFSSASISKDTLRRLGVQPRLDAEPFPREVLGFSMVSFYGGRSECRIRRTPVPVTYLDVKSMYPGVSKLLGLQELMAANRVAVRDSETEPGLLEETQAFLDGLTLEDGLHRETWGRLRGIALVEPRGDLLPIRADWQAEALGIAQCFVESAGEAAWWALPDLAAARIRGPHAPAIKRVILFDADALASNLRSTTLAGRRLDLRRHNLYTSLIETRETKGKEDQRWDRFLKVVANSLYGITAEMNAERTVDGKDTGVAVHALHSFIASTRLPESPGLFFFAPVAALTTAGARLVLAALERLVTDVGGAWCFADTDSMAVVSSQKGVFVPCPGGTDRMPDGREVVKALSWADVDEIRAHVNALSPFDERVIQDFLKVEEVNFEGSDPAKPRRELWAWAISAKRYMLFVPSRRGLRIVETTDTEEPEDELEPDEIAEHRLHGLGHLMNPKDPDSSDTAWTEETWAWMIAADQHPEDPPAEPAWFDLPALSKHTVSSPNLLRAFHAHNLGRSYTEAIKPFNFLLVAHLTDEERRRRGPEFRLGAPYSKDRKDWAEPVWRNVRASASKSGAAFSITTGPISEDESIVQVKSYGDVIGEYLDHPEAKAVDAAGRECREETRGLLFPPHVKVTRWHAIGKETNELESRQVGLAGTHEVTNVYREPGDEEQNRLLDAMNRLGVERLWNETVKLAERYDAPAGTKPMAKTTIRDILKGRTSGTPAHTRMLREAAKRGMRSWLRAMERTPERGSLSALVDQFNEAWVELVERASERYEEALTKLDRMPRGSIRMIVTSTGVSRQKLRTLGDPERRAALVQAIEAIQTRDPGK